MGRECDTRAPVSAILTCVQRRSLHESDQVPARVLRPTLGRLPDVDEPDMPLESPNGWLALEQGGFAACVVDRQLRYRRVNAAWEAHLQGDMFKFGRRPVALTGRRILDDIPSDRRERWAQALGDIVGGRLGHFVDPSPEASSTGDRMVVTAASPTLASGGTVDGALCVRYDVTESWRAGANQERMAEVLMVARRLQHFLGNQLALTLGYVELLTFDPRLPPELRDRVDEALRGVIEATETLSKLRLLTRLEMSHDDPSIRDLLGPPPPP